MGDALGAALEFRSLRDIRRDYGPSGPDHFVPAYGRSGAITDDTQMTLFTAEGLIRSYVRSAAKGISDSTTVIANAYQRWLITQGGHSTTLDSVDGWLSAVDALHSRRAPGTTCLSALMSGETGTPGSGLNNSKGCGAVMRVAPVGLVMAEPFDVAVAAGAITHGHPSGYLAGGALAEMIAVLVRGEDLRAAVAAGRTSLDGIDRGDEVRDRLDQAIELAARGTPSPEDLETLGGGWTGEEALAIAVCAALRAEDIRHGLRVAVLHSGDSDSTGAICGNLLGAACGEEVLPKDLLAELELADVITRVADDLVDICIEGRDLGTAETWARYPGW